MTNREHAEKICAMVYDEPIFLIEESEIEKVEQYLNRVWPEKEELKPDWEKLREEFAKEFGYDRIIWDAFVWFKSKLT